MKETDNIKIFVDADGCPVVKQTEEVAIKYDVPVTLLCDTNHINGLSDDLKFVFKAWDDEHEGEPDLLSYNMVYSEVCRRADEECFPPDEWAEDKYWWSFRHPLDNEVKRLREKVDYDDARNKKWNKKSGPHNSEGPILLVTK